MSLLKVEAAPAHRGALSMKNRWTGGQYSLFRILFGSSLLIHFAQLLPRGAELFSDQGVLPASASPLLRAFPNVLALSDAPWAVTTLLSLALVASGLFIVGWWDRFAAIFLWYVWACLFGRNPLISNPGLPYVGLLLVVHAFLPRAPYGSLERTRDVDPGSSWRMPADRFAVVWILMAVGYTYSGFTKWVSPSWLDGSAVEYVLRSPLARPGPVRDWLLTWPSSLLQAMSYGALAAEVLFAPLACVARLRPYVWMLLLSMHIGLIALIDFADLSLGMVMLHLFTFNPKWVQARSPELTEHLFYDGNCGLCHRAVRFVLSEDFSGTAFRFAPLQGEAFTRLVAESQRSSLPDSVVVLCANGSLKVRSEAVLHLLSRLGGFWRVLAVVMGWVPASVLNRGYDFIARIRGRLFAKPKDACPLLPPALRVRFDMEP
jgi:predicted DCC family thiol-disulfide oxidoreductase YuxK